MTRQITPDLESLYTSLCQASATSIDIHEHLPTLRRYAGMCGHITEFGVRWVVSTWALLAGKPYSMVSYDINYHSNVSKVIEMAKKNEINFSFVLGDTLKVNIENTDLLFIDTLHTYDQLDGELTRHGNKSNRFIIMHDTMKYAHVGMDKKPIGLVDAINKFITTNQEWKIKEVFPNNNGLTVLQRLR